MRRLFGALAAFLMAVAMPIAAHAAVDTGIIVTLPGGTIRTTLTSSSATACTSLEVNNTGNGRLSRVIDASGAGQSVTLTLYDEGASPTCASANQIYAVVLLTGQVISLDIPLNNGLAYKLSSAATNNILIDRI